MKQDVAVVVSPFQCNSIGNKVQACWYCGAKPGDMPVCQDCCIAQEPEKVNYFALFGLTPGFDIDLAILEQRYLALQQQLHPDKFTSRSEQDKEHSLVYSTLLNDAYTTLLPPLRRAEYILLGQGIDVHDSHAGVKLPPALLMEAMELREQIDEADGPAILNQLLRSVRKEEKHCVQAIHQAIVMQQWRQAAQHTMHLQYISKAIQAIKQRLLAI